MPLGNKRRSSSASGRLETKHVTSILTELWSTGDRRTGTGCRSEKVTDDLSAPRRGGVSEKRQEQPEWVVRELLRQNRRRHSVTLGDEAQIKRQQHHNIDSNHSLKIDETISLDNLQKLKLGFEEFETGGLRSIDAKNFGRIVKKCLGLPKTSNAQIQGLFKKIDYSGQVLISSNVTQGHFCTHMLQEYKEKQETARRSKQVAFTLPASMKASCHGVPIANIHATPDGSIVTVREDGVVCYWSPELNPLKTKHMFNEGPANRKSKWASDFTVMTEFNKLMIGTGDREIQLYELSTLEPYCQINALDTVPLTLDYGYTGPDKCCILYGDTEGCVTIILISSVGDTLRLWNKLPKIENIPNIAADNAVLSPNVTFVRWKVHQDWVTQAKYFQSFQAVVSSSNEEASSLVIGCVLPLTDAEQQLSEIREACYEGKIKKVQLSWTPQLRAACDQTVFTIDKGVKTFDLCQKHSLLVTGGMDRLIRMWNPHFSGKPTGVLKGHSAPIVYLRIIAEDSQVFSVSTDSTVKIWDIQDQCCLFTADPKASGIHGDISACSYSSAMKSFYIAADCMAVLSLKIRPRIHRRLTVSHNEPVMCCGYSEEFRQVVSCTEGSVVKVWDFDTGHEVFEFGGSHDLSAITCMAFDPKGRRLITGGQDGCLKIWNFNNGQCLKTLKKDGDCHEVCDCIFLQVHRNFYVMSVGRDRKIDIYPDIPEDLHHVQRPQPSWQDDLKNGHREDILCVAQCPPSLLATGSYDGEIIVWNVVSGRIQCRFVSPLLAEHQNVEGLDTSVPSIIFLKNSKLQQVSSGTALLSSGAMGCINLWKVLSGGRFVGSFKASRFNKKIIKLATADKDTLLYAADRIGYVYVYNMEKFVPEQKSPKAENFWRAHTSTITGLQIVDNDQVVLTSSTDYTVRLWSAHGEFIGTFGQSESWSVHISSSWKHPAVPYEVLIDPLSMPDDETLNVKTRLSDATNPVKTGAHGGELKSETHTKPRLPSTSISDTDIEKD
ncbi:WD repeat-containing protein on Y chromosome [Centropristis striata]|uniref:WD repeat-containing protein on Y chromosome n=1 Tax=Centropristis striata TaxID=184440 RepID=UPI0027E046B6|nr:WD repeat-containing protein on Y chromosome [Centropristis striata]